MSKNQKIIAGIVVLIIVIGGVWYVKHKPKSATKQININPQASTGPANTGPVSPISGVSCDNWNRRPVAVMQPADVSARPAAGFSQADMVFEMPVFTNSNTRLMGVYVCNLPDEIGSIRSARHDYLPLAKSLDAIYVHWGYSKFAQTLLSQKILDNIDCLTTDYCARWPETGKMKLEDTGHITSAKIQEATQKYGYHTDDKFAGYPHQDEIAVDQRPATGKLRVAYPKPYDVTYQYNKANNSWDRIWAGVQDTDKNNGQKVSPKNVVVMFAEDSQIKLADEQSYKDKGLLDPWSLVPQDEQAGLDYGGVGRYNNLQIGDPWFDTQDSGQAKFYLNGKEFTGTWKKDKSKLDSKLFFLDDSGQEIKFVPGEIWVDVVEPDMGVTWNPQG